MKVVIQCAGKKFETAGCLKDPEGECVFFVAQPDKSPSKHLFGRPCRPDDRIGNEVWRDLLTQYNDRFTNDGVNPDGLYAASDLYKAPIYKKLVAALGASNVYILSAGWGLVRADYLLPAYNITFSKSRSVSLDARRERQREAYWHDYNQLTNADLQPNEEIHFFGSPHYLRLYYQLANEVGGCKVIHHKVEARPRPGYKCHRHVGRLRTNWHYEAAEELIRSLAGNAP